MLYDIILPLAIDGVFTYNIPQELNGEPQPGMRVLVPIGKKKIQTGILYKEHIDEISPEIVIKDVILFLDAQPIVTPQQLELWQWMADYYMCQLGEVMKAALPAALRLESETHVCINPDYIAEGVFHPTQQKILDILADGKEKNVEELSRQLGLTTILPQVQCLQQLGALFIGEKVEEKYRPKQEAWVSLCKEYTDENKLIAKLNSLEKAPKQQKLLLFFLELLATEERQCVRKEDLLTLSGFSANILKTLIEKNILQQHLCNKKIKNGNSVTLVPPNLLNEAQQNAMKQIIEEWKEKDVVLFHGVTGSGKTEVYIQLIQNTIDQGKEVLYLVPEIALTTQLTSRLAAIFGDEMSVYHSRISDIERADIYQKLLNKNTGKILLGVRSALFLPFTNIGLIIVDEEHDGSYKQTDPAPRYNARNSAIILAKKFQAKVLLGTATPSIETYYNAKTGKYGLVKLHKRYADLLMPQISIIDTKRQYHRKEMQGHFSDQLVQKISAEIDRQKQVIVFQNRRGYAPWVECKQCGYVPKCVNCDVSLTLHKRHGTLVCHYCGYTIPLPQFCPVCHQQTLSDCGVGTEKIEDEIKSLFPSARVTRMDLDTTRIKNAYQHIIDNFADHKTDILVGTQMVAKGLDFSDVSTVAVLNADSLMNMPDFRSYEKAFQMLEQVSGRAGRKYEQGEVVIQTVNPRNELLKYVADHDYEAMYESQLSERKDFKYPPFVRLMVVIIKHREIVKVNQVAHILQNQLHSVFTRRCSQVVEPIISRVQNMFVRHIILKIETNVSYSIAKRMLEEQIVTVKKTDVAKGAIIYVDVDPL